MEVKERHEKAASFGGRGTRVGMPALILTRSCVAPGKLTHWACVSIPMKVGWEIIPLSLQRDHVCKELEECAEPASKETPDPQSGRRQFTD